MIEKIQTKGDFFAPKLSMKRAVVVDLIIGYENRSVNKTEQSRARFFFSPLPKDINSFFIVLICSLKFIVLS